MVTKQDEHGLSRKVVHKLLSHEVTSAVDSLVMHIIKERLQTWVEDERVLAELENGFQKGERRLEDNLF